MNTDRLRFAVVSTLGAGLMLVVLLNALVGARASTVISDESPGLSIGDVSVPEGDSGNTVKVLFTVTLSAASGQTVTVDYATADGTAAVGSDYISASGTLVFTPGTTRELITAAVRGDVTDEDDETFYVNLTGAARAVISDTQGVCTVTDDDPKPSVSIGDVSVPEGDEGETTIVTFTVMLSAETGKTVTVDYATADGTAAVGSDYISASGTLVFNPGTTRELITAIVKGDVTDEHDETFYVNLSDAAKAFISDTQGVCTITDDDPKPSISIGDVSVPEGDEGETTIVTFTVMLSAETGKTVTVDYATADGTAVAGADYVSVTGIVAFAPGITRQSISVTVNGDNLDEDDEFFYVDLSNLANAILHDHEGVGTILDDDPLPTVNFDRALYIVDEGAEPPTITLILEPASGREVIVGYATSADSAEAGVDFEAVTGHLVFEPGDTIEAFRAGTIISDALDEHPETVVLTLTSMSSVTPGPDVPAMLTIRDDDPLPDVSIDNVTVSEGHEGATVRAEFIVRLSVKSGRMVRVSYATDDDSAHASSDYVSASGTVDFPAKVTSQPIIITVKGDILDEHDETFHVKLANSIYGTISGTRGVGTIADDDPPPSITIDDVSVLEGDEGDEVDAVFTVKLSPESGKTVIVDHATSDCTADAWKDYWPTSGPLVFSPGDPTRTIPVGVIGDNLVEQHELFYVSLSNPINAYISDTRGVGTIIDDEIPSISIDDADVDEGDEGDRTQVVFSVTLSVESDNLVLVNYATADGTAKGNEDYEPAGGTVGFSPGVVMQTVTVTVIGDALHEHDEIFYVNLSDPFNATISRSQAVGTIIDDERLVYLPLILRSYARWRQWPRTEGVHLRSPSGCRNIWYAGAHQDVSKADAGVWRTGNEGATWEVFPFLDDHERPRPSYPVVADPNNCDRAFASVWGDVFLIPDECRINGDLPDPYVYGLAISGGMVYAGTHASGVYRVDAENVDCVNNTRWEPMNSGIDQKRIRSLTVTGNRIYAGARGCTLYLSDNEGESWSKVGEESVLTSGCEDAAVWSAAKVADTHYAGLGQGSGRVGKGLYYTNLEQSSWKQVKAIPTQSVYGLAYDTSNDYLYVSVYTRGIYCCSVDEAGVVQDCCHQNEHDLGLSTGKTREIQVHDGSLVVGSDDGIWSLPIGVCPCSLIRPSAGSVRRPGPRGFGDIAVKKSWHRRLQPHPR